MNQYIFIILFVLLSHLGYSQKPIIDKVIAVVGNNAILLSDLENQYHQMPDKSKYDHIDLKCNILEELIYQNFLLHQAEIDSVTVGDKEVESEMERRLRYFISQIGSEKKLEEYFNKSIIDIKADLRKSLRKQMLAEKMQEKITGKIKVTPTDVRNFYNSIPADSIPTIHEQVEYQQIVIYPTISEKEKIEAKEKLNHIRERILKGESFSTLAVLYSEDPGSALRGGELGFFTRSDMVPEFSGAAFKLKEGEVSPIIETEYGYHIIQLIERKGEQINARHILITIKSNFEELMKAKAKAQNIYQKIISDSITFSKAATIYSMDKNTAYNEGIAVNMMNNTTRFDIDQLDPATAKQIENLKSGQISQPFEFSNEQGKKGYKIIKLKARFKEHKANLKEDYNYIQQLTQEYKKQEAIKNWILNKMKSTYFTIDEEYKKCEFNLLKL
ncbi:MAG: peptidylprolyl isomerase [Bacteroidales bacterium]|nr:peptidylprolyl isomerase [Bacteroidales bacterium]